jgi:hypothetical protein
MLPRVRLSFIHLPGFVSECDRLGLGDEAIAELEWQIMERPESGKVLRGTGGLRKIRFAPGSWQRGKRGAIRVLYVYFVRAELVYFVTAFAKNEKGNISKAEANAYKALLSRLEKSL